MGTLGRRRRAPHWWCAGAGTLSMIAIADYGIGNLGSIRNIIKHVGGTAEITRDKGVIREARGVVIPGVGSFDACMTALRRSGLLQPIESALGQGVPVLGICVGMQMM